MGNVCSVWRENLGVYDYFLTAKPPLQHYSPRLSGMSGTGTPIQARLPWLPDGAKRFGRGARALGTIVQERSSMTLSQLLRAPGMGELNLERVLAARRGLQVIPQSQIQAGLAPTEAPLETPAGVNWWVVGGVVLAVGAGVAGVVYMKRRKARKP